MEILLFVTSCIFLMSAAYFHNRVDSQFNRTTKGILFTASVVYSFMGFLYADNPDTVLRAWRYFDWFITVPLLLTELFLFLDKKLRKQSDLIITIGLSIIMLSFGLLGELKYMDKWIANIMGTIPAVGMFYILFKKTPMEHLKFLKSVVLLWLFYPIVFMFNDNNLTIILFSIVDLTVKIGTAFYIKKQEKFFV